MVNKLPDSPPPIAANTLPLFLTPGAQLCCTLNHWGVLKTPMPHLSSDQLNQSLWARTQAPVTFKAPQVTQICGQGGEPLSL